VSQIFTSILVLLFAFASHAAIYNFVPENGKVNFKTKGWPSLITIKGESKGVTGKLEEKKGKVSGTLTFELSTLKTGISLRDSHMKDNYLEVKKHPQAKLTLKDLAIPKGANGEIEFSGEMEIHGEKKEVKGKAKLSSKDGKEISMTAEIPLKLTDFKIDIPSYKGITVAEDVTVNFESKVVKK
jgi:polyisoprenoid-binding protein YceI